jgi:hypothetical protein
VSWRKKKKECLDERGRGGDGRGVVKKKPDFCASSPPPRDPLSLRVLDSENRGIEGKMEQWSSLFLSLK